ncbi:MAG TPA: aminotransferase class I/II-fold pyridoxal phosphate-dependent enzyme [Bryobacteraceae bacterium]|nr:aminotransferase class I/II-fold pyridoxal phosphate-dependent enzyme [Bryobacteraceae bacterium]
MTITHGGAIHLAAERRGVPLTQILDFSASINPLGPPPGVKPAIVAALDRIEHYPDPYSAMLTRKLAQFWKTDPDCILLGNGATDLIHFIARCWPQSRTHLVVPTFSEFQRAWPKAHHVALHERWPDDGLLVVTNPVNPTGELVHIPGRFGPTLVDESFLPFTKASSSGNALLRLRSLTKFYALPGLRIGALLGPADTITDLKRVREPWQVNALAEAAMAAALDDAEYADATRRFVETEALFLSSELARIPGVTVQKPAANYIFARLSCPARSLSEHMEQRNILIRVCTGWPGIEGEAVRVAVRTRAENLRLIESWKEFC